MPKTLCAVLWLICLWSTASAQQVLRWGADPSGGAPYVYTDPANPERYIGYEKEMVDALAAAMGRRAEFVPSDWETLVSALQRGSFDVIVNGLEPTGDRAQQILFSNPYYIFQLQLTVRRDDDRIKSLDDCKNRTVGTLGNTAASRLLQQQGIPLRSYADPVGAYRDLELKRIDAVVMDVPAEAFYARNNPKLKPAGPPFTRGLYVIGLRKGDFELKSEVDAAINKIIVDGTLETILKKWGLWNEAQAEFQGPIRAGTQTAANVQEFTPTTSSFNWGEALWRLTRAAAVTVGIALGSMVIAVVLGLPLAVGQWKGPAWVRVFCTFYVEFFRGTPVLVQLLFLYFGLPVIGIAMPGWLTALVGLGLNYAAYESQVYRAALEAIPTGQWEAAYSLGMSPVLAFRHIILPQAFRIALPPMTNDFVSLFKDTSVAFAISVWELATAYRELANASGQFLLLGLAVSAFYLAMSLPMAHLARLLERRLRDRATERVVEQEATA
ncbi:MAG TPA: ABC transporter substrate-binding protein/permease [Pyrinomonadaceae bacterium]|nr:ABC transporter substrate-binding protein/permease [Pyrinomonadaceae bacterium]